jgi:hypothetical protein
VAQVTRCERDVELHLDRIYWLYRVHEDALIGTEVKISSSSSTRMIVCITHPLMSVIANETPRSIIQKQARNLRPLYSAATYPPSGASSLRSHQSAPPKLHFRLTAQSQGQSCGLNGVNLESELGQNRVVSMFQRRQSVGTMNKRLPNVDSACSLSISIIHYKSCGFLGVDKLCNSFFERVSVWSKSHSAQRNSGRSKIPLRSC